ncbi:MAG: acyl-homoserine-lactone synthase [Pseudomonadota bacterium]
MIRYLYASELADHPDLAADMFRDRAVQFRDRMGWDVKVDSLGWETDAYDLADPLYLIAEDGQGGHAGSMRFLPTTGPTMLADAFPDLTGGSPIRSGRIWEVTRFCLAPNAAAGVARRLLLGASELGLGMGLTHAIGVFDQPMLRVYRRLGWQPAVLGLQDRIAAGLWAFSEDVHDKLLQSCDLSARQSRRWFEAAFGDIPGLGPLPTRV